MAEGSSTRPRFVLRRFVLEFVDTDDVSGSSRRGERKKRDCMYPLVTGWGTVSPECDGGGLLFIRGGSSGSGMGLSRKRRSIFAYGLEFCIFRVLSRPLFVFIC
jgi:hypothetical protein